MAQYIYLIRNGDLYNIGKTEQLELIKKSLAPGKVEAILQTNEATSILKILQNKYAKRVLPGSNYFRLTKEEFIECKRQLEIGQNINDFKPFFTGIRLLTTFLVAWVTITFLIIRFGIEPVFDKFS